MPSIKEIGLFILVVALSGAGYFCSTGFLAIGWLAWIAPLPLLFYGLDRPLIWVIIAACLVGALSGLGVYPYVLAGLPKALLINHVLSNAISYAVIYGLLAFFYPRCSPYVAVLLFPLLWVTVEFFIQRQGTNGTLDSLAYTQLSFLPLIQVASITGLLGIVFLLTLLPSVVMGLFVLRGKPSLMLWQLVWLIAFFVPVLVFGMMRLYVPSPSKTLRVGLTAVPVTQPMLHNPNLSVVMPIVQSYITKIQQLAAQGVNVVVLPEKIFSIHTVDQMVPQYEFEQIAKKTHVMLIVGVKVLNGDQGQNVAWVFSQGGGLIATYVKQHLVQGLEDHLIPGNSAVALITKDGVAGIAICHDMDFIQPALSYAWGASALFVPALDFKVDARMHATPAILRGVEGGFSVVRAAQWGALSVSDNRGRVLAWVMTNDEHPASLVVNVPMATDRSIYARTGDWFGWLALLLLAIIVIMTAKRYKPCKIS